jgi:hypothetical protein
LYINVRHNPNGFKTRIFSRLVEPKAGNMV